MADYSIHRPRINRVTQDQMIAELKNAAQHFGYKKFSRHDFDKVSATVKGTAILSCFGSWDNALKATGIELSPNVKDRSIIKTEELFIEMDRIWTALGHRPSKSEWDVSEPKFSYTTYKTRFRGWVNACEEFLKWKGLDKKITLEPDADKNTRATSKKISKQEIRDIPLKLRLKVLSRDNYKCVLCGQSPSHDPSIKLHVDHIHPYSKGGKTAEDNLRTLCNLCNWGKGSD